MSDICGRPRQTAGAVARAGVGAVGLRLDGGLNAIVVTFVFSVYLTGSVGDDLPGDTSPASWLGWALFVAGVDGRIARPRHRGLGRRAAATPAQRWRCSPRWWCC